MSPRPPPRDALTAVRRFGLGPKPGEVTAIAADPRGAVLRQISDTRVAVMAETPPLRPSHALEAELREIRFMRRVVATFGQPAPATSKPAEGQPTAEMAAQAPIIANGFIRGTLADEAGARLATARTTETPFAERLVYFWSNHFTVALRKVRVIVGAYEREAIRPHVLGRFADMLKAVVQHPAMLFYLDNNASIGPNSKAGLAAARGGRNRGLNENLAREILELHTLGVDGGYTQTDVTNLSRMLTGWTAGVDANTPPEKLGRFEFVENRHEPGKVTILGKSYGDAGMASGLAVLDDIARHPATARHVARQLARHFISDKPPQSLVDRLAKTFRDTQGDLAAVSAALLAAPEAWSTPAMKVLPPFDFLVSLQRGGLFDINPQETMRLSNILGQPLWNAPSPKGWPDDDDAWISPSPLRERLRIAELAASKLTASDPRALLASLTADTVGEETRLAVHRAEAREQAIELMIMSPEFIRR